MRARQIVLRSLTYYWRTNVAVVLGVATAVSVLAGALLVGDSVRGSLRDLLLGRLGKTDQVVVSTTLTDAYRYDGWGVQVASAGSVSNPYRYRGLLNLANDTGTAIAESHRLIETIADGLQGAEDTLALRFIEYLTYQVRATPCLC